MRTRFAFFASLPLALVCACASSSVQKVPMPPQDTPVSSADMCRIYILRDSGVRGSLRSVSVFDGDVEIGTIDSDDYLCWERTPGRTLVRLYYEGVSIGVGKAEGLLDFRGEAGHRYVYAIGLSYSDRKPEPVLMTDKEASEALASRKPASVH
jgi:hypothetical protein